LIRKCRIKLWGILAIVPVLLLLQSQAAAEEASGSKTGIKFYYSNACASCHEEDIYGDIVRTGLEGITDRYPHEIWMYNCFKTDGKKKYQEELAARGWTQEEAALPLMVIGDHKVSGEEEMRGQIRELFLKEADASYTEEKIQFFSTKSCKDCEKARELLDEDGAAIEEFTIDNPEHLELLYQYFETYGVKEEDQQVPIAFRGGRYFPGVDGIRQVLDTQTEASQLIHETELANEQDKTPVLTWRDTGKVVLTGLVNGLNPCSASLLLFLLSLFAVSKVSIIKVGFSYLAGRFAAYMATGLGIFSLGTFFQGNSMGGGIAKWIFILLAILLVGLNLLDFMHIRRQEYEKVALQLPKTVKHWNYEKIRRLQKVSSRWLILAVFLIGLVISAGEFFCTGQIYAAVIVSMLQAKTQLMTAAVLLCIYVFAMCIPHAILIGLVNKSKNLMDASSLSLKQMPYYKLISAGIFLIFAIWMFYSI
jgi:glutaredoxin